MLRPVCPEHLAVAVLDANVRFAQVESQYALAVLQWWPFRLILFVVMAVRATRFCLIVLDSTWWWLSGYTVGGRHMIGDACSWSVPPLRGAYGNAEMQFLLFFVIAKPVDTAISGALSPATRRHIGVEGSFPFRRDRQIAGKQVRHRREVGQPLDIGVTAQRVHAAAAHADIAQDQLEHRHGADVLRTLGMLRPSAATPTPSNIAAGAVAHRPRQ